MKKLIALILTAVVMLSSGTSLAPAASADAGLPPVADSAEVAVVDDFLLGVEPGATAADVKSYFTGAVTVHDATGAGQGDDAPVASGWLVASGSAVAVILIAGELTGDAKINARDVIALMGFFVGKDAPDYDAVADIVPDGAVNARDVVALMEYLVGWDVTLGERFFKTDGRA